MSLREATVVIHCHIQECSLHHAPREEQKTALHIQSAVFIMHHEKQQKTHPLYRSAVHHHFTRCKRRLHSTYRVQSICPSHGEAIEDCTPHTECSLHHAPREETEDSLHIQSAVSPSLHEVQQKTALHIQSAVSPSPREATEDSTATVWGVSLHHAPREEQKTHSTC